MHHLFIHCSFTSKVWHVVFHCKIGFESYRGKVDWKMMLMTTLWNVWLERNHRIFNNEKNYVPLVIDLIFYQVSQWVAKRKVLEGYSSADISRSWSSLFEDERRNTRLSIKWIRP